MQRILAVLALALAATPALAANVGVSVTIGEPNYYGRIDVVDYPPPQLIYPQPVIIEPVPVGVAPQPIYVHVPDKEAKQWRKYCKKYKACGQPVYFVQDVWYNDVYVPEHGKKAKKEKPEKPDKPKKPKHD